MNENNTPLFAEIALPVPLDKFFTYRIPQRLKARVQPGMRVVVPFGTRRMTGYVVEVHGRAPGGIRLKEIASCVDKYPLLNNKLIVLARWISSYYMHPLGEVLKVMLPASLKGKSRGKRTGSVEPDFPEEAIRPELTVDQRRAVDMITLHLRRGIFSRHLLYGVTGSGKTEVYIRCIEEALKIGKSAIVLIPEIALIPQTTARFKRRFGDVVEVLHSRLTSAQRYEIFGKAHSGQVRVVIGPRSAVFVPIKDLGIIVVDEEQDDSFKQQEKPHYSAVGVAEKRAEIESAVVLLGSATPSLETYHLARTGVINMLKLMSRPVESPMPEITVVDMRGRAGVFSDELLDALTECVERGEKALVLLNRRGHANFIQCRECGWIAYCPNCSISLTFHSRGLKLLCHYCGHSESPPDVCPKCGGYKLQHRGYGTQRVEMELTSLVPGARVARMDMDTTRGKWGHEKVLDEFISGRRDILLGTQMIAKGHHYPDITLIGILGADYGLHFPDFRSVERTFRLLYQAAGRTARGRRGGRVIIQTYAPDHYIFSYLKEHDYEGFAMQELNSRKELRYPPSGRLVLLTVHSRSEKKAKTVGEVLCARLESALGERVELLGPTEALISRIKSRFRVQILIKGSFNVGDKEKVARVCREILSENRGVEIEWDVDPIDLL